MMGREPLKWCESVCMHELARVSVLKALWATIILHNWRINAYNFLRLEEECHQDTLIYTIIHQD